MKIKTFIIALTLLPLAAMAMPQHSNSCSLSTNGVNFGLYNPLSSVGDRSNGKVTVRCRYKTSMSIKLSTGSSRRYLPYRTMRYGNNVLNYNLYTSSNLRFIWGNGRGGSNFYRFTNLKCAIKTIFGYIPPRQDARPGTYSDTITVSVQF